ncbi:TPA: hypothetical protein ACGOWD_002289 [Streptococcus suis]
MKDKKLVISVVVTAIVSVIGSFLLFNLLSDNGVVFNNTLSNGVYVNNETDFPITLEIDENTALLTLSGLSQTAEIDRDNQTIKADGSSYKYKMVAGKLVLDLNGREVAFTKSTKEVEEQDTDTSNSETIESSSSSSSSSSNSTNTLTLIEDTVNDNIGMSLGLLNEALSDIRYSDSFDGKYIADEVVDENGDYLGGLGFANLKEYKVVKLLSLENDEGVYRLKVVAKQ